MCCLGGQAGASAAAGSVPVLGHAVRRFESTRAPDEVIDFRLTIEQAPLEPRFCLFI